MKNKKSLIQFILIVTGLGIIGGLAGFFGSMNETALREIFTSVQTYFISFLKRFHYLAGIALPVWGTLLFLRLKKFRQNSLSEEDFYFEQTLKIHHIYTFISLSVVLNFVSFIIASIYDLSTFSDSEDLHLVTKIILDVLFLCVSTFYCVYLEVRTVNFQKQENPEKKGDPLQLRFEKDWLNSSDEAEKLLIFHASYKSFLLLRYSILICLILSSFCGILLNTGILAPLLLGIILLIHTVSYQVYYTKLFRCRR